MKVDLSKVDMVCVFDKNGNILYSSDFSTIRVVKSRFSGDRLEIVK